MYIQSQEKDGGGGFTLPRDYRGNAFATGESVAACEAACAPPAPEEEAPPQAAQAPSASCDPPREAKAEEAAAAGAFHTARPQPRENSIFAKLPFLSPLLPPARGGSERSGLPEWAIIGLVLLLLLSDKEGSNDLLPFVLLLLLWD